MDEPRVDHWQAVWTTRPPAELSWHQCQAALSRSLIMAADVPHDAPVIDVGGGDSPLAGDLLALGYTDVTVLDISAAAIDQGRSRLGPNAERVTWVVGDVLASVPARRYAVWHDRAVFHFLTSEPDQERYAMTAAARVEPGGWLVIATFALEGPEQCSGLPVHRHDAESLTAAFRSSFRPVEFRDETHVTPGGAEQRFVYGRLQRI